MSTYQSPGEILRGGTGLVGKTGFGMGRLASLKSKGAAFTASVRTLKLPRILEAISLKPWVRFALREILKASRIWSLTAPATSAIPKDASRVIPSIACIAPLFSSSASRFSPLAIASESMSLQYSPRPFRVFAICSSAERGAIR